MIEDRWLQTLQQRLELLGVPEASIVAFTEFWENEASDEQRVVLRAYSDRRLLREVGAVEAMQDNPATRGWGEEDWPPVPPDAEAIDWSLEGPNPALDLEPGDDVLAEAIKVVEDSTIPQVLEWVGDDRARARAALDAEEGFGEEKRPSLLRRLAKLADPQPADV